MAEWPFCNSSATSPGEDPRNQSPGSVILNPKLFKPSGSATPKNFKVQGTAMPLELNCLSGNYDSKNKPSFMSKLEGIKGNKS